MRLLDVQTLRIENFVDDRSVEGGYAILSHTWSADPRNEVIYDDLKDGQDLWDDYRRRKVKSKSGFYKVDGACQQAHKDGYRFIWIDTCCIKKEDSAELSEAINSMYRWYANAGVCYAYLPDIAPDSSNDDNPETGPEAAKEPLSQQEKLANSRWFTRGWTLQELIAPSELYFFNRAWQKIGSKASHAAALAQITGIDESILRNRHLLNTACIANKMSWAAQRRTTRVEDEAYSLIGIFDINMPMIYGEGSRAFLRLQEEIIKKSTDLSIFAWNPQEAKARATLFAPSVKDFASGRRVASIDSTDGEIFQLTNKGLQITLRGLDEGDSFIASLMCHTKDEPNKEICLRLRKMPQKQQHPGAVEDALICEVDRGMSDLQISPQQKMQRQTLIILRDTLTLDVYVRFEAKDNIAIFKEPDTFSWDQDLQQVYLHCVDFRRLSWSRLVVFHDDHAATLKFGQFLKREGSHSTFRLQWSSAPLEEDEDEKALGIELPSLTAWSTDLGDGKCFRATADLQSMPRRFNDGFKFGEPMWSVTLELVDVADVSSDVHRRNIPSAHAGKLDTIRSTSSTLANAYKRQALDTGRRWDRATDAYVDKKIDFAETKTVEYLQEAKKEVTEKLGRLLKHL